MSLFFADLVRETSWGTGPGDLPLEGALPGHRRFADTAPPGARFHYCIAGITHPDEWETGEGEIGSGGTLVRFPLASSAGPSTGSGQAEPVDFSTGLKTIALTVAADWFAAREDGTTISNIAGLQNALDAKQPLDGTLTAIAGLAGAVDTLPYFTAADAAALTGFPAFGRTLVASASAADARSDLAISATNTPFVPAGNVAATDMQAAIEELDGEKLAASAYTAADLLAKLLTVDGSGSGVDADLIRGTLPTIFGLSLLEDADAATARATLGVTATGVDISYAYRANNLSDLANAATARSNLGLGAIATQAASNVAITGGTISGVSSLAVSVDITATDQLGIGPYPSLTLRAHVYDTSNVGVSFTTAAPSAISDFSSAGLALEFTRPTDGAIAQSAIFHYQATSGQNLAIAGRTAVVICVGGAANYKTAVDVLRITSSFVDNTTEYRIDDIKVVGNRRTGWSVPTGTATRTAFDTATVTTAQLAGRVKALIDDLTAHGLIGS